MSDKQTCPRRMNDFGPWERAENLDSWTKGRGLVSQSDFLSCNFCGSLNPDTFMELIEQGWLVGPTDKSYKAYLSEPVTDEEAERRKQQWATSNHGVGGAIRRMLTEEGKSEEEITAALDAEWERNHRPLIHGRKEAKFYYQHLGAEQRQRFVEMANTGAMNIGYPGRFYTLPFFIVPVEPTSAPAQ